MTTDPRQNMDAYLRSLQEDLAVSYPGVHHALGMAAREVEIRTRKVGSHGMVIIHAPGGTNFDIVVSPDGAHMVHGKIKDKGIERTFQYRPVAPGLHRGTLSDIIHFIEDLVAAGSRLVYKVYGLGPLQEFASEEDLLRVHQATGRTSDEGPLRRELRNQPYLRNLVGPMWDGRKGDVGVVRYETQELYDLNSD